MGSGHDSVTTKLPVVPHDELVARLDAARRGLPGRIAIALDADGTLWSGDVGYDLFRAALASRALRSVAAPALAREAAEAGLGAPGGDPHDLAARLFAAWAAGSYEDERAFRMMAWAFAGFSRAELLAFAERALAEAAVASRVLAPVASVVSWAQAAGVEVWIVSASPRAAVEVGVRHLSIDPSRVLAVTPVERDGLLTTELEEPVPFHGGKPTALRAAAPDAVLLAAFGDSPFDLPMLREARIPVAVGPGDRLRQAASTLPELVEIALDPAEGA